jgi:hypothetical protein
VLPNSHSVPTFPDYRKVPFHRLTADRPTADLPAVWVMHDAMIVYTELGMGICGGCSPG